MGPVVYFWTINFKFKLVYIAELLYTPVKYLSQQIR